VSGVGGSELAVAGMGDVLTGAIAGLLAQGLSPVDATGLALVATARAAARRGAGPGLVASDVPDQLSAALAELGPGHSELDEPWVTLDLDPAR
jgi:NAD(P)H-hydrate repair Nnr-like enzyme with NAD(P)H-hydrate dehydratase domain